MSTLHYPLYYTLYFQLTNCLFISTTLLNKSKWWKFQDNLQVSSLSSEVLKLAFALKECKRMTIQPFDTDIPFLKVSNAPRRCSMCRQITHPMPTASEQFGGSIHRLSVLNIWCKRIEKQNSILHCLHNADKKGGQGFAEVARTRLTYCTSDLLLYDKLAFCQALTTRYFWVSLSSKSIDQPGGKSAMYSISVSAIAVRTSRLIPPISKSCKYLLPWVIDKEEAVAAAATRRLQAFEWGFPCRRFTQINW